MRWLPIFHNSDDNQLYFYDYTQKEVTLLKAFEDNKEYNSDTDHILLQNVNNQPTDQYWCRFTDEMLIKMNLDRQKLKDFKIIPSLAFLGSQTAYFIQPSSIELCNTEYTYLVGTYQHMLFACGLKHDNTPFTQDDTEWNAYNEFHEKMTLNPLNPWAKINKEDLLEYHLAEIFKTTPELKEMALNSVNFYNNPWQYYTDSFEFYDSPNSLTRTKFSEKQTHLPGEEQMLAYYFSSQLRFTWAASIGFEALMTIEELDEELGENTINALKTFKWMPFVPSTEKILKEAEKQKYKTLNGTKYSFLDTWDAIKEIFINTITTPLNKVDFVTFSGHGCVISFDPELVELQPHENKPVARRLGVEMWETLYEKGIKPFYQKPGTAEDFIKFPIN